MKGRPTQLLARLAALLLVLVYAWLVWLPDAEDDDDGDGDRQAEIQVNGLTIIDVRPHSVAPGSSMVVSFDLPDPEAEVDELRARVQDRVLKPIELHRREAIFRLPDDVAIGPTQVEIVAGDEVSPAYGVAVETISLRKVMRNLLGGISLVLLGLIMLSKALRRRAGRSLRRRVGGMTASSWRSLSLGVGAGALTQSSTATAAIALPFLERRLLNFGGALALLLGAHVGAAAIGAALPLAGTKHAPLVIAVGVVLRLAANGRRERASANLVIGLGVLLHGIYMLRTGFAPLAEQPTVLLELRHIDPTSLWGLLLAAAIGAVLGVATQGPGPVFVLVLSVAQSTNILSMTQALAFLAAAPLGSALSSILLSSTMGKEARRLAVGHVILALAMLVVSWALIFVVPGWVDQLIDGSPTKLAHGKKILHPHMALHLAVSFVAIQVIATLAVLPLVRPLGVRLRPASVRPTTRDLTGRGPSLASIVKAQRAALDAAHRVWLGEEDELASFENQLADTRRIAANHLERDPRLRDEAHDGLLISVMAQQQALEHLRDTVGRLSRRGWVLEGPSRKAIASLHELVRAGLSANIALLADEDGPTIDQLRSREIETNSLEAELRKQVEAQMATLKGNQARRLLLVAELAGAYEGVGNQNYRLGISLIPDDEDF